MTGDERSEVVDSKTRDEPTMAEDDHQVPDNETCKPEVELSEEMRLRLVRQVSGHCTPLLLWIPI